MNGFIRFFAVFSILFVTLDTHAHEIFGMVQVLLKGEKRVSDLSSVIVYLDPVSQAPIPAEALKKNFMMSTKNKQFAPRVLAVPAGSSVEFPNYDSIFHNIFSVSAPNRFDLGLYKGGDSKTQILQHPGVVKVFCNVHPQMSATIVVTSSPYYTIADKKGYFSLSNIPNGTYQLHAYAEQGQMMQKVTVMGKPLQVNLSIDGRNFKKVKHKNKFGKDYEDERY